MKKIGIVGSGNMGRTLGLLWMSKGYDVFFGGRSPEALDYIQKHAVSPIKCGSLAESIEFGDILFYSLRDVMPSRILRKDAFKNKIIIDPNDGEIPNNFEYPPRIISYAEMYRVDVPGATIVKAFNTMAQEVYYLPTEQLRTFHISSPFCMDNEENKQDIIDLIERTGLIPLDCGTINQSAKILESFADLTRLLIINKHFGGMLTFSANVLPEPKEFAFGIRQATKYR